MNSRDMKTLQALRRVQGWTAANPDVLGPAAQAGTPASGAVAQAAVLDGVVHRLSDHAQRQDMLRMAGAGTSAAAQNLRAELRTQHLIPIARVARHTLTKPDVRNIGPALKVPNSRAKVESLLAAADGLATAVTPYEAVLVAHGLPADFLARLTDATNAVRTMIDERGQMRGTGVGTTVGVHAELVLGRKTVSLLDVPITLALKDDPIRLAEWRNVKRATPRVSSAHAVTTPGAGSTAPGAAPASAPVTTGTPARAAIESVPAISEVKAA